MEEDVQEEKKEEEKEVEEEEKEVEEEEKEVEGGGQRGGAKFRLRLALLSPRSEKWKRRKERREFFRFRSAFMRISAPHSSRHHRCTDASLLLSGSRFRG